ncbi:hypothetical protein RJ641_034966 [Dillenia turbinata]|uniref:RING-type E3 ubiquitin transferase n=1 Tax=Dillenia turbinata TaxID=194707 RepID=A0AAN8VS53_9MAGN
MEVDARRFSLFQSQLIGSREMISAIEGNTNVYGSQTGFGVLAPITDSTAEAQLPFYNSMIADSVPASKAMKTESSGLTYNVPPLCVSRKRSRNSISPLITSFPSQIKDNSIINNHHSLRGCSFSFLGEDISFQIQQQQWEIDRFIIQHTEKVRLELEEKRRIHSRRIAEVVEEGIIKRLKAKEEEIEKIGRLNCALEERVKSLCIENQIWRDLAQTNEATANALRTNLEQVLAQVTDDHQHYRTPQNDVVVLTDEAVSSCGSTGGYCGGVEREEGEEEELKRRRRLAEEERWEGVKDKSRVCRSCGKEEACVLLLPCRHLCLCTVCGSTLHTCPVCQSNKNASVHVNLS